MFIKELYDQDVLRIETERPPIFRESNIGWPSEALVTLGDFSVGECSRSLFYKALGIPYSNKMGVRIRRICDSGIMYEHKLIAQFKRMNKHLVDQARIEYAMPDTQNEVILSGKLDAIIKDDGTIKGVEIKSIDGFKAGKIFGEGIRAVSPLPAPNNLMQAMLYKYEANRTLIEGHEVKEMILLYVNRGSGTTMFFIVDIDKEGYPVVTPISMEGRKHAVVRLADHPGYDALLAHSAVATSDQSRHAELKININSIFNKFDTTYSYIRERELPPKDYKLAYTIEEAEKQYHCGRLSKIKLNKIAKGEPIGDARCAYCNYRVKCASDDGVKLKT